MAFGRNNSGRPSVKKKKKSFHATAGSKAGIDKASMSGGRESSTKTNKKTLNSKRPSLGKKNKQLHVKNTTDTPVIKQTRTAKNSSTSKHKNKASTTILGHQIKQHETSRERATNSKRHKNKAKTKKITLIVTLAILVIAIGVTAGIIGFLFHTSNKIAVSAETKKALSRAQDNVPSYMLFAADTKNGASIDSIDYDTLFLCRVDFSDKQVIIISVPIDTYVASASGGAATLSEICQNKGDAGLIEAVSSFSDVSINYFVKANGTAISDIVDYFGGIDVNLEEEVDDPSAGSVYIPSDESHLDGEGTLTLLRAQNFTGGTDVISSNKRQVARGLTKSIFGVSQKFEMNPIIEAISDNFRTNMSVNELGSFYTRLYGLDPSTILDCDVPGYRTVRQNKKVFIVDATKWKSIRTNMGYGNVESTEETVTTADIDPGSFTIQIQNGAGVDGAASMLASTLTSQGYKVTETGNADATIYKETLIIYDKDEMKKNAQAVMNTINNGRLVQANGMYNLKTDVLIIIGADLKI